MAAPGVWRFPRRRRSSGLQHAERKGAYFVRHLLGLDLVADENAAANAVSIALRHEIPHNRRLGSRENELPRQLCPLDPLRVGVDVEIADVGNGPWRPEHLVGNA